MSDRILRDELWDSDRFLDLPTDTQRLAFIRLLSAADDFGNLEGGLRRVYRVLTRCMHVRSPEETAAILSALADADLIRFYEIQEPGSDPEVIHSARRLIHIPRFRSHRQYYVRKVPASPWCSAAPVLGKNMKKNRVINRGLAKNLVTRSLPDSNEKVAIQQPDGYHLAQGEGEGEGEKLSVTPSEVREPAEAQASRRGALAGMLRQLGVKVTSQDPRVVQLAEQGVTDAQAREAVDRARLHKPEGPIPMGYLEPVLRDVVAGKGGSKGPSWWTSNEGIDAKGREIGLSPGTHEDYAAFADRIKREIVRRIREKAISA